jgi:ABC-2 type transport system ATP-binding protein
MSSTNSLAIQVEELFMRYGAKTALKGVDLEVPLGQKIAILGPNGAGKTTLMEVLEGFRAPSAGSVQVLGSSPYSGDHEWRSRLGIVFQSANDHRRWRVSELLEYVARAHQLTGRMPTRSLEEVYSSWELHDIIDKQLKDLSGGQRRRVDVAAALVGEPDILFLDEPTAGFDPAMRKVFHKVVGKLSPAITLLLATHDLEEAEAVCDRILLIKDGQIVADGTSDDLRRKFTDVTTVSWLSSSDGPMEVKLKDANGLIAKLALDSSVSNLEIRRGTLEEAYLSIVADSESLVESSEGI